MSNIHALINMHIMLNRYVYHVFRYIYAVYIFITSTLANDIRTTLVLFSLYDVRTSLSFSFTNLRDRSLLWRGVAPKS